MLDSVVWGEKLTLTAGKGLCYGTGQQYAMHNVQPAFVLPLYLQTTLRQTLTELCKPECIP